MMRAYRKIKLLVAALFDHEARIGYTVSKFAHTNNDLLIIALDPKTDLLFASYKNKTVSSKIKGVNGKNLHVVREVLKHSRFKDTSDSFLASVMEALHLDIKSGNQFYHWLDGAVFNIAKAVRGKAKETVQPGAVPSPFVSEGSIKN